MVLQSTLEVMLLEVCMVAHAEVFLMSAMVTHAPWQFLKQCVVLGADGNNR